MRVLLILAVVVALLALVGWIKFHNTPQQSTITIDKQTIQQDTERMAERGKEFVEDARQAVGTERTEPDNSPTGQPPSSNQPSPPPVEQQQETLDLPTQQPVTPVR